MRLFPTFLIVVGLAWIEPAAGVTVSASSPPISPGVQVVDVAGNAVGTVQSVRGSELVLETDRHEVRLPISSFTPDKGKLVFGLTREALNQATDAMLAKALLPGSEVRGKNGGLAGRIETIDEQFVTVELATGQSIRLPRSSIAPASDGAALGITVAELLQMVNKSVSPTP